MSKQIESRLALYIHICYLLVVANGLIPVNIIYLFTSQYKNLKPKKKKKKTRIFGLEKCTEIPLH